MSTELIRKYIDLIDNIIKEAVDKALDEKWSGEVQLNPSKKGMFKGKTKSDLEKELAALHRTGPHKKGSPEYTKQQELNFAIRAKSGWK